MNGRQRKWNPIYWKTDDGPLEWTGRLAVSTHGATTYIPETFHDLRTLRNSPLVRHAGSLAVLLLDAVWDVGVDGAQCGQGEWVQI
jgi:hypothetical protein